MNIKDLIGEATEYDKKLALEEKKPKSWCKSVSAFANTLGGALIFGISNDDEIVGLENPIKDAEKISELIKSRLNPIPEFNLKFHKTEDEKVLIILDIFKGEETPYYYAADGDLEAYVRVGNESVKATPTEQKRLVLRGKNTSYDLQKSTFKVEDYAYSQLRARYKKWTGNSFDEKDLVSFGLANEEGYLTNAGALLADDSPIRWSRLFCTRWNGLNKSGGTLDALDDAEYLGSVISLIENGEAFIKRNAKMKWKKTPNSRIEMPDYVERSYHEALVNALAHRDYLVNGSEVHIDIYDDRMEIYSPGGMPDGSLIQERDPLTVPSTRRNPVLADVFNRLGYMERKGSGFGRIISSYEFQANYSEDKKPKFRSDRYQFTVVLPNLNYGVDEHNVEFINDTKEISGANDAKVGADDANMENQIDILMKKMIENPQITQNKLASELGVSRRTVQRMIEKLVSDAKIIRVGSKRSGYWQVVK
ncbi:MAG: putative DNA binding domain-containing protein [Lachnospiraceae bacterium]|nr:putative DNA binding domain-containing protein [Lachnospiraceae bacterium]